MIKPKSARQARGGLSFDIRMLDYLNVKNESVAKRRGTDAFEVPVCESGAVQIFQTLGRPIELSSRFSGGSGGEK